MKKNKLLIPLISLSGVAATVAPVVCLTSCSKSEIEDEQAFAFATGTKAITPDLPTTSGQMVFTFTPRDTITEESAKLIKVTAVITKDNSYVHLNQLWSEFSADYKTLTVYVDWNIDHSGFYPGTDAQGKKNPANAVEFNIKIENGTWYKNETGFSVTATAHYE